jgi:tetratricopeptide (TPR) repeat protein
MDSGKPSNDRNLRSRGVAAAALAALFASPASAQQGSDSRRLAKVVAAQNVVESRRAGAEAWTRTAADESLFARDRVRTGAASRAAILYADDTLHRLDEKSEVEVVPPATDGGGVLEVLSGRHYFASRKPKDFGRVETSTVTAAIKGTEFAVDVAEDGTTSITMIEGVVLASNAFGSVEVSAGERAVAEPGKAPVRSVVVRPRDAVTWTLYYPPVLGGADAERLGGMGPDGASLSRAASLLATGQVDEAKRLVEAVRTNRPDEPAALSLAAVIALTENRKDEARRLADAAVAADGRSASAALASSFVAQAEFDVARAAVEAERAAELDPKDPTALARAAELRMAEGDLRGAKTAAESALERAPENARALSVLGFVELAGQRSKEAKALFDRAAASDPGFADARLGLGIAKMRLRDLAGGREEIQSAAILDPGSSLLRSYLGKAYYEEKRSDEARKELAAAKDLDPADPTPWLYSAILLQNENRPVEALDDLMASIERNDNRAVYRSRVLLDQDRAVRGADLARIFNDLGFEDAGLVAARRSADEDHANHSSHLLLSGVYRNLPGFAPAFLSEVLQARIYQPVGTNAARPDVVNASASFNEYTALFERPRVRAFGSAGYGETDTDLSAFDTGDDCGGIPCYKLSENDSSTITEGEAIVTSNGDRYAAALSYSTFSDDGFRRNADEDTEVFRAFVQAAVSDRDTIQVNAIRGERETGDLPLRQILPAITPERFDTTETNVGLGWHRTLAPGSDLAVSAIWNRTEQTPMDFFGTAFGTATLEGPQLEAQWVKRHGRTSWITGVGGFDGSVELTSAGGASIEADDSFFNGYAYAKVGGLGPVDLTVGASGENVDVPVGFLAPRDSQFGVADLNYSTSSVSPKVGVTVGFRTGTTLRVAAYHRLAPFLGRLQTLEPTQVAGFNQFFEDPGGTRSWSYGAGIDQAFGSRWFLGASVLRRDLEIPEAYCDRETEWNEFSGCAGFVPSTVEERDRDEDWINAYVSAAPTGWMAVTIAYDDRDAEFDTTAVTPTGAFQDRIRTERLRPEVRFFCPIGVFLYLSGTRYDQEVDQFDTLTSTDRNTVKSEFWVADAAIGYRFPKRWGSFVVDARNVLDKKFEFYERSVQEGVVPARSVVARLVLTY